MYTTRNYLITSITNNYSITALIQMVIDICNKYGYSLTMACICITAAQTCLLLWWGVFFVGLISNASTGYAELLIVVMSFSLYWITNFFHAFMSYVVGGCIVWYFVKDTNANLDASNRITLLMQCALTTSLGSLCKGALLCGPAHAILSLSHWSRGRPYVPVSSCSRRGIVANLIKPFVGAARRYNRLSLCLTATYGRTLCKAAEEYSSIHPETLDIAAEDLTGYTLSASAICFAGMIAICIGMLAERLDGASLPLFYLVSFYLAFCGMSLVVHTYRSAVDALVVVYALQPEKFAR